MYGLNYVVGYGYKDYMEKFEIMIGVFMKFLKFDWLKIF